MPKRQPVCKHPAFDPDDWFPTQETSEARIVEVAGRCLGCPFFDACDDIPAEYGIFAGKLRKLCDARF